ncbi:MAG: hypothetical protein OEV89_08115 [Desulfobulbaceae bacterium]|nr:hypothetical protein [Desulfobulbaceae bacterium]
MDFSHGSEFVRTLDRRISAFIHRGLDHQDETRFNELALLEFELCYRTVPLYRQYCRKINISPSTISCWQQIPAVGRFPFRALLRRVMPPGEAEQAYFANTVADIGKKVSKAHGTPEYAALVRAAFDVQARVHLFSDVKRIKIFAMLPSPGMAPGMVMAVGAKRMIEQFGAPGSRFLISPRGLDLKGLISALRQAEKAGEPLALIGGTRGFDHFLNACRQQQVSFRLPEGSRICDSGGYAGRYRECTSGEYFEKCRTVLGVRAEFCVNALWICGSSTVYYDNVLENFLAGKDGVRCKNSPPWVRTLVVDPLKFKEVPKGEIGLLRHYDLSNRANAFAVQFDTLGYATADGFEIIGKWNRKIGAVDFDHGGEHPGGKLATRLTDFLMRRKFSRIGRINSAIGD